ncbi:hypothetical protein EI42_04397 [Thermosporothrix hazakensis]|jgi:hypothetical protein|uniref:Uncharacterized protein n=1 Tax=Thermosporothrix hazakensis TaxID=644383 RepID=A0A326UEZ7_THEHA|nr:hypothetical protein [Thermosporothrix hazakensis]PZW25345.1 hypothetical protein EI42_04397 [Thermosporothrix hazakensis]
MDFPKYLLPTIAPLPKAFAVHILAFMCKKYERKSEKDILHFFLKSLQEKRSIVYRFAHPFVLNRNKNVPVFVKLSTEWLKKALYENAPEALSEHERRVPASTYSYWVRSGYILHDGFGRPNPHSAAAVLMMRMLIDEPWRLFPEAVPEHERFCWVQLTPKSAPFVCQITMLEHLPPSALAWSPWAGEASWEGSWERIGDFGSIRFAGSRCVDGRLWWTLQEADLWSWDPDIRSHVPAFPGDEAELFQAAARFSLHRLAKHRLPYRFLEGEEHDRVC